MTNVRVEEEEDANIIAVLEKSAPKQNLSEMRRAHSDQLFASICESNTTVRSTNTLAKCKSHTDFSNATSDMIDQQMLYKSNGNGKATIDRNFFKSMAKMIKANRPSKADADIVDEMGIDLKFRLLHERIRACEPSNDPNVGDETK